MDAAGRWRCGAAAALALWLAASPRAAGAEEKAAPPVFPSAVDAVMLTPEQIDERLLAVAISYSGEHPEELLNILDVLMQRARAPADQARDEGAERVGEGFGPSVRRVVDMLYEWPSERLTAAVRERLQGSGDRLLAGLTAAVAIAGDPAQAAFLFELATRAAAAGETEHAVLALLAVGECRAAALLPKLEPFLNHQHPACREAAARSAHLIRVATGGAPVPPLDPATPLPPACSAGPGLLDLYPTVPRVALTNAAARLLTISLTGRGAAQITPELIAVVERVLTAGGTVILSAPAGTWPASFEEWAAKQKVTLPGQPRSAHGAGAVNPAEYRAFADYPFEPRDQPGRAADLAWRQWAPPLAAPLLAGNGAGAIVVVQEGAMGAGRLVLTTIDLAERPIYRENLLRWVYGDALLAHAYQFTKDYSFEPTGQTEHFSWLKPLAADKPKVLYLTSSLFKRGLLEVLQRLDAEWRYVPYDATLTLPAKENDKIIPPARMAQRAVCLLEQALPWADAVVFDAGGHNMLKSLTASIDGSLSLGIAPARLRRAVYRRVHEDGIGLVGISSSPEPLDPNMVEFAGRAGGDAADAAACRAFVAALNPIAREDAFRMARRGKGRLFWYNRKLLHIDPGYPEKTVVPKAFDVPGLYEPQRPLDSRQYDYALLARAVLWSAGKEALPRIATAEADSGAAPRVRLTLDRPFTGVCEIRFRDAYAEAAATVNAAVAGNEAVIEAPPLPAGPYVAEVRLARADGAVADIAAVRLDADAPVRIAGVRPDKRFYDPGETARLAVAFSAPAAGEVALEVRDTWGRLLFTDRRRLDAPAAGVELEVPVAHPLTRLWDAHIALARDGRVLSRWRQPLGIRLPPRERDFDVTAAPTDDTVLTFFRDRMATDIVYGDAERAFRRRFDMSAGIWSDSIGALNTPGVRSDPRAREPCLNAPSFRLRAYRDLQAAAERWRDVGIRDYMIGDEVGLGGRCFAPDSLARFRTKMREAYGTLDALNREWGSAFARWDDVLPCEGGSAERPAAYVDFDLFTSWAFAEYASYLEMLAGETIGTFYAGHSGGIHDNVMMHLAGSLYYYGVIEQAVSMKRPDAVIGCWYAPGYSFRETHETESRHWPWWHLFRGTTRIQIWHPQSGPPAYHEDLSRPYNAFAWMAEEMADIRLGIGKLFLHAQREEGPAAVYLSQRSLFTASALQELAKDEEKRKKRSPASSVCALMQKAILAAQVECRYLSEYQAEAGEIARRGLKLIVLPGACSLSARERAALKAFVEAGGTLAADAEAGSRNEHGTLQPQSLLQEWLGDLPAITANGRSEAVPLGRGRIVVCDFDAWVAASKTADGKEDGAGHAAALLRLAGLTPEVAVTTAEGKPLPVTFGLFRDGAATYFGFAGLGKGGRVADEPSVAVDLSLRAPAHVYNARHGGYLGQTASWKTNAVAGLAQVYAALPWRLDGIDVAIAETACRPGAVVSCTGRARVSGAPEPGLQVWLVQVRGPDGARYPAFTRRLVVRGGQGAFVLPLPLDAAPGDWEVTLRDAATGVTGSGRFHVTEAKP